MFERIQSKFNYVMCIKPRKRLKQNL